MAVEKVFKEVGKKILIDGLGGSIEKLKEGQSIPEALKEGLDVAKESAFKELDKYLSPETQKDLSESKNKLDSVQEQIETESEKVKENPAEVVDETNEVVDKVNEAAKELNLENKEASFLSEIKEGLQEFKDILDQIQEVQDKLKELGVSPDLLSMLNAEANEIDEMDEDEIGEE